MTGNSERRNEILDNCYPLVADTDALKLVETTDFSDQLYENIGVTTTKTCYDELENNRTNNHLFQKACNRFNNSNNSPNIVTSEGIQSGRDSGEESIKALLDMEQEAGREDIQGVYILDFNARKKGGPLHDVRPEVLPPNILIANLKEQVSGFDKKEACEATESMIIYLEPMKATRMKSLWSALDIDCRPHISAMKWRRFNLK